MGGGASSLQACQKSQTTRERGSDSSQVRLMQVQYLSIRWTYWHSSKSGGGVQKPPLN